jgi:Family of unknown function (DUF6459)
MSPSPPASPREPRSGARSSACCLVLPLVPGLGRPPTKKRPLPDAAAVRLVAVPDSGPPYDDERAPAGPGEPERPRGRSLTTVGQHAPAGPAGPADQRAAADQPAGADQHATTDEGAAAKRRTAPGEPGGSPASRGQAAPAAWPSQFAQVLAETLAGARPPGQITPWTTDQARKRIRQLGATLAGGVQPRVRRVVTSRPSAGVVEMTVIVGFGPQVRALAVRLERDTRHPASAGRPGTPPRWICTAIEAA